MPRETREAYVLANNNDGFELWFGTRDRWSHHMSSGEVRTLTRYLLWDWYVKARWLGLRRPIYYWALHRHRGIRLHPFLRLDRRRHGIRLRPFFRLHPYHRRHGIRRR